MKSVGGNVVEIVRVAGRLFVLRHVGDKVRVDKWKPAVLARSTEPAPWCPSLLGAGEVGMSGDLCLAAAGGLGDGGEQVGALLRRLPAPAIGNLLFVLAASHRLTRKAKKTGEISVGFNAEGGFGLGEGRVHAASKSSVTMRCQP